MFELDPKNLAAPTTLSHDRQLTVCRFSPDGERLFAAGYDGRLYRWRLAGAAGAAGAAVDAKLPQAKESFEAHRGWVEAMTVLPDGERLVTADSWGQVCCWRIADEAMKPTWTIDSACGSWLRSLAVSGDGRWLATCGNEPVVRVYSAVDGKLAHELRGHERPVFSVAFTPDGTGLASGDLAGAVRHWNVADGRFVRQLDARRLFKTFHQYQQGGVRAMAFAVDGKTLYCGGFEGTNANQAQGVPTVVPLDWTDGAAREAMTPAEPFNGPIMDLVVHRSGWLIGTGSSEAGGALWFWKPGDAKSSHLVKFKNSFRRIDVAPDGTRLAVAAFGDMGGQRGGNGRRLNKAGEYEDFGGSVALYAWKASS